MKNKTSVKNKTRMKNKTHKGVGGKKLRSKTNRRKYKSRFSKKTLKRGGGACTSKNINGNNENKKEDGDEAKLKAMEAKLKETIKEVDALTKAFEMDWGKKKVPGTSDDHGADDETLLEELGAESEGTLSEEEVCKKLAELEKEMEEEKVKGGTRTPDEIKNQCRKWIASLKYYMTINNDRIKTLSALTNRNTEQEEQLKASLLYKERLDLLKCKIMRLFNKVNNLISR
jgi:hypothetical protein